ncbi:putative Enoyl-CoA hydratase [Thiomonas sp. X19]|uniref:enoyl-CoA hydratase n=1 Tax=Thiomonas sp. X19 TaxID=1050370 RepID=UPI000B746E37|nr:enoyl-CoA hydratase [Thiomonas sp. X19]SCC93669.1 putative Enoyl-CoA hydratase [Thiomonas sp. X19]
MNAVLQAQPPLVLNTRDARGVVTLTLNRPQAFNALSDALLGALQAEIDALQGDSSARVVIIQGAGRAFCAGHDLKEMRAEPSAEKSSDLFERCSKVMLGLLALPQPVIARVHGIATAAGCQLVAQCDLAVAASDARFAVSGINVGLFCSTPSVPLARNVPRKVAMEMLLTGDFIDAATALRWGLVNRVAAPEALDAEVEKLVQSILAKPASAIAMGKAQFYRQIEMGIASAYQLAGQTMTCNFMTEEALEGVQAFIDKRAPAWRGGH